MKRRGGSSCGRGAVLTSMIFLLCLFFLTAAAVVVLEIDGLRSTEILDGLLFRRGLFYRDRLVRDLYVPLARGGAVTGQPREVVGDRDQGDALDLGLDVGLGEQN